jgi:hypothetical protein
MPFLAHCRLRGTHKEGYHGPHLASDHHGSDAFRAHLDCAFLGGVGFLASLSAVVTFYFLKHDPGLVESRLKVGPAAEHEKSQKIIQTLTAILWCALLIVPGIERHFHSSRIPAALVLVAMGSWRWVTTSCFSRYWRTDGLPALSKCSRVRVSFRPVPTASSAIQCIRAVC